ncbi:hypothetical protein V5N11_015547 [Cardamine amara subsp. amara]|uniref:Replication protein A 70 kDa DNA-binding subunit B/D first OB fold domain-containing protein n=1 Tax=Cardamine amara subsp. amara TaxID=228776 RepID=A0ABD0ZU14_CARAN
MAHLLANAIRVKVLKNFQRSFGPHNTVNQILVDSKGQKIHDIIDQDFTPRYNRKLIEGQWISITGFKFSVACGTFRHVPHRFVIHWESTTVVSPIPPITSGNYYSFASFKDVKSDILEIIYTMLVNFIGQVVRVGNDRKEGPPNRDWDAIYLELEDGEYDIF